MKIILSGFIALSIGCYLGALEQPSLDTMRGGRSSTLLPNQTEKDKAITEAINQAILNDHYLAPYRGYIEIYTTGGIVTLTGTLNTNTIRLGMEKKAKDASGVEQVLNYIDVTHVQ